MPDDPRVTATENGPYRVTGVTRVRWRRIARTTEGEPVAWHDGEVIVDPADELWLCRCGQSRNKPFCDSSHRRVDFQADDPADPGPRADRARTYGRDGATLDDDRTLCVHAGFCGTRLTNAWKLAARSELDAAATSQLVSMGSHCPSGAIRVTLDGEALDPPLPVEVVVVPDGPLWVTGGVVVERSDGVELERRQRVTLCRCGASANKPLCDGSHAEIGFQHHPD